MSADDMPVVNTDNLNPKDCSTQDNQDDLYSQNGNHGIGHMSDGAIKGNAKVAGSIEENNKNQSQNTNNQFIVNFNQQNKPNLPKTENDTENNQKKIKASVKQGDTEYSAEAPTVKEVIGVATANGQKTTLDV